MPFSPTCEVAKNSPESEKSMERGALLNWIQSIRLPVKISKTLIVLSNEDTISQLLSGFEKHRSVMRFYDTSGNDLTFLSPLLMFTIWTEKSLVDRAIKSLMWL